jgi:heme exporter protein A
MLVRPTDPEAQLLERARKRRHCRPANSQQVDGVNFLGFAYLQDRRPAYPPGSGMEKGFAVIAECAMVGSPIGAQQEPTTAKIPANRQEQRMQPAPLFSVSTLSKRFGHRFVLEDISFDIFPGDFLLLLGSNGAGKSTLLKILSSLMRQSEGSLHFDGQPYPTAGAGLRKAIGMISHESQFYGDLTARENLRVFGTLYGVSDLRAKIDDALKEFNLDAFPDVPVRAFSSGMLKRLALGRLVLYRPPVLLLDEPYSGLDQKSVRLLDGFLERFKNSGGTTIMVTHQFTSGVSVCNRLLILHRGGLVYNRPVDGLNAETCAAVLEKHTSDASISTPRKTQDKT